MNGGHADTVDIESNALLDCWVEFSEMLDIKSLLPHLCSHHLLSLHDREKLMNACMTNYEKVNYLLTVLPKKDKGWFKKFLDCLFQSTEGTVHASLATRLKLKYDEELKKSERHTQARSCNQVMQGKTLEVRSVN